MVGPLEVLARLRKQYGPQGAWWPVDQAYHDRHGTDPRFEVILGAFLTQNTTWGSVEKALENLKQRRLLDPKRLARASAADVGEAIRAAGTYAQKARYLQGFARYLTTTFNGDLSRLLSKPVPELRPLLLSFDGVGEETADDILVYAAHQPRFIVDAYCRRITRRLGLGTGEESYEALQVRWAQRLQKDWKAFAEAHALLVEHAKRLCTAKLPRCPECPLESVCPQVGVEKDVYRRLPNE